MKGLLQEEDAKEPPELQPDVFESPDAREAVAFVEADAAPLPPPLPPFSSPH